jgi:hypothetical protein
MPRIAPAIAALCLLTSVAIAEPFDRCGAFVDGLEGCVLFQPDGDSQQFLPDFTPPPVGTRARIRGDMTPCASICFVPCIQSAVSSPCVLPCAADFDASGVLAPADIFAFLNAWFSGLISADYNHSGGLTVQDIFDFLNAWFAGCP